MGKARKSTKLIVSLMAATRVTSPGDRASTESKLAATNMATESAANDHANHDAARAFIAPATEACSLVPSVTTPRQLRTSELISTYVNMVPYMHDA